MFKSSSVFLFCGRVVSGCKTRLDTFKTVTVSLFGHEISRGFDGPPKPWENLAPLTDENLVLGKPDMYHGPVPQNLLIKVRNALIEHMLPRDYIKHSIGPNYCLQVKTPNAKPFMRS